MPGAMQHAGVRLALEALGHAEVEADRQPQILVKIAHGLDRNAGELTNIPCGSSAVDVEHAVQALRGEAQAFRSAAQQLTAQARAAEARAADAVATPIEAVVT